MSYVIVVEDDPDSREMLSVLAQAQHPTCEMQ